MCIEQTIDFATNKWSRVVKDLECLQTVRESTWDFPAASSDRVYAEDNGPDLAALEAAAYQSAYDKSFTAGFIVASDEAVATDEFSPEELKKITEEYAEWVVDQDQATHYFTCDSEIRIDHPFPENENLWSFWAAQDCNDYDLIMTVLID